MPVAYSASGLPRVVLLLVQTSEVKTRRSSWLFRPRWARAQALHLGVQEGGP